jgi:hypothetical protein
MRIGRQQIKLRRLGFIQVFKERGIFNSILFSRFGFFCKQGSIFMKTPLMVSLMFSAAVLNLAAQTAGSSVTPNLAPISGTPQDTPYSVVQRDANSSTWQRTTYEQMPSGDWIPHVESYQEVATGLNFKDPDTGEWTESAEVIEPISGGAVARHGQHKIIFAADLATSGAIDMETPDGQRLQSDLLGLSYYDRASGQTVFIAEVTNSIGQLISTNQVWYDNAFNGIKAGVRYTYTREGFEQDVILEEQPPAPETYGLNSATTVLQAYTEFISPPTPIVSMGFIPMGTGVQLSDENLSFRTMKIGHGRAFLMGNSSHSVSVAKTWTTIAGRQFLIEEVPMAQIGQQLQTLPPASTASMRFSNSIVNVVSSKRLPTQPIVKAGTNAMRVVSLPARTSGFVLDWFTVNTSQTNYTFQTASTYYISGNVNLFGTNTTFECATVLKYASGVSLTVNTPVTWLAGPYRPVVMVAKDDNTVGETVSGSTGAPGANYYAAKALYFDGTSALTNLSLQNLRILNANAGIVINGQSGHVLNDVQLLKCANGIAATNTDFALRNALMGNVLTNFTGSNAIGRVEHLTSSTGTWLNQDIGTNLFLTNSLIVAVANLGNCSTQNVAVLSTTNGVFQTVGRGSYYLATNSPYRDAGTENISPNMLAALRQKTTYPPIVYQDTNINAVTTFGPVIQRDSDTPDLGYHYDPMDYAFSGVLANTNVTFAPGTAVGWYLASGDSSALHLANKQIATFAGTFSNPDYFVRCSTVQEGGNGNWPASWAIMGIIGTADQNLQDVTLSPELRMTFTTCSVLSSGEQSFRDYTGYLIVRANNSRITGGNQGGYIISCYLTNCLIEGAQMGQVAGWPGNAWIARNCTLHEGGLQLQRYHSPPIPVSIRDCSFDAVNIYTNGDAFITNTNYSDFDYNAYTNAAPLFPIGCSHDQKAITFKWQTGPAGNYYLPGSSTLTNAGDVTADMVGLYHFTTQTNQVKETNSIVDIGYHYVALDSLGNPVDTDGDGVPDYLEDANGNGLVDAGESSWLLNAYNGLSTANGLQVFTPLK